MLLCTNWQLSACGNVSPNSSGGRQASETLSLPAHTNGPQHMHGLRSNSKTEQQKSFLRAQAREGPRPAAEVGSAGFHHRGASELMVEELSQDDSDSAKMLEMNPDILPSPLQVTQEPRPSPPPQTCVPALPPLPGGARGPTPSHRGARPTYPRPSQPEITAGYPDSHPAASPSPTGSRTRAPAVPSPP